MLTANSQGNTDIGNLTGGAALQKDPFSKSIRGKNFKEYIKSLKGKFFQKSRLKISKDDYNSNPTHSQKQAGNYKKAHVKVQGFDISIENPKGTYRCGKDSNGKEWKNKMVHHYGYFKRTLGKDGDHIDCFIGPNIKSELVFIINQIKPSSGIFDEHKVMLGFESLEEAKDGYLANYTPGWKGLGDIQSMTVDQFRTWLEKADTTKKAKAVIIKSSLKNFFVKSNKAQVGETRTWSDGKQHRKTDNGWVEVSGNKQTSTPSQDSNDKRKSNVDSNSGQNKTYEQKAVEALERWKEFEQLAKERNKQRISKMKPEKRNEAFDIKNAEPGDIVRIERPIDGRVNRGHLAKVLDKIDGHLKVMLPSGSIFLFLAADLAFAKSSKKHFIDKLFPFIKGKLAQVGEIRTWSDGNKYRKESNGWRMIGESENKAAHQTTSKKAGISKEEHSQATEKAMQNGIKIPVKVLREYPALLEKYPKYKERVSAIDSISKGMKKGEKIGNQLEKTANTLKQGKIPDAIKSIDLIKTNQNSSDKTGKAKIQASEKLNNLMSSKGQLKGAVKKIKSEAKLKLTSKEQKRVDDLENKNLATEAIMVYANKLKNKKYLFALKENRKKHLKLGHLSSELKKERDDIYHEVMREFKSDSERLGKINKPETLTDSQIFENVRDASLLDSKKLQKNVSLIDIQIAMAEKQGKVNALRKLEVKGTIYRVAQLLQSDKSMTKDDVASLVRHGADLPGQ